MSTKHEKRKKEKAEEPAGATVAAPEPSPGLRAAESAPSPPLVAAPPAMAAYSPAWMPYTPSFVVPSSCGCGGGETCTCGARPQLVYALGTIDYDFGIEARHDAFLQLFKGYNARVGLTGNDQLLNPYDAGQILSYLGNGTKDDDGNRDDDKPGKAPSYAPALIWTLKHETTPIYAIQPAGPFAGNIYKWLRKYLYEQLTEDADRVCIPGTIHGKVTLLNGQVVPVIVPEQRGMWAWSTQDWVDKVIGKKPTKGVKAWEDKKKGFKNILDRIYYEIRNLGLTSQERALNHAATDAFQILETLNDLDPGTELDSIEVEKSPMCRPGSDCWDVKLVFFYTENINKSNKVYRFTIDVSDVIPVTVGDIRSWSVR